MGKRIAIVQSNYLPWKGYFDLIATVDEFILYDDMQYTRRDWRNRNQIKTPDGLQWLTVPVRVKGKYDQTIRETEIEGSHWVREHLASVAQHYSKAPYIRDVLALLTPILEQGHTHLSPLNRALLETINGYLGIGTKLSNSWDYTLADGKSDRLADLVQQAGGSTYISGPSAKGYLDEAVFAQRGIAVEWFSYEGYPQYPQGHGEFTHTISIIDLLAHCGKDAPRYMKMGG